MLTALLAFALAQESITLGTVDVGGRPVAVTVPSQRGPFNDQTPNVVLNDWKFQLSPDGNLGVRYKSDGGWGEVADAYPGASARSASSTEYRVKVFLFTNTNILEHGRDGVWRERRGTLEARAIDTIYSSLARFKALAEVAAEGGVRVTFDVSVDDDLLFRVAKSDSAVPPSLESKRLVLGWRPFTGQLLGPEFVYDEIGPRVNNDPFESEDGRYRGPYSSVFVVHGMRTGGVSTEMLDRTPVTTVSWPTFTQESPGEALSIALFQSWIGHLAASARAKNNDVAVSPAPYNGARWPQVYGTPVTPGLLALGNHFANPGYGDPAEAQLAPITPAQADALSLSGAPLLGPHGETTLFPAGRRTADLGVDKVAVHAAVAGRFVRIHPEAKLLGRIADGRGGWDWLVFEAPEVRTTNDLSVLQIQPDSIPATLMASPGQDQAVVAPSPVAYGDFAAKTVEDPLRGPVAEIQENGADRRGYVVLAVAEPGQALFRATADNGLTFRAQNQLSDSYVLRLTTRGGATVDVLLFGEARTPQETNAVVDVLDFSAPPGETWAEFKVPLSSIAGEDVVEIRLCPPRLASWYERESDGSKPVRITAITVGALGPGASTGKAPNADMEWLRNAKEPLDEQSAALMKLQLLNPDPAMRLNALGAMTRIKHPALIPEIAMSTNSGSHGEAYLAIQALKHQDDDRAWSQIAFTAVRGPLGHNYLFAAEALASKNDPVTIELLSIPLISRSRHARIASVRALNAFDGEQAGIVAAATLGNGDPDPSVRYALVAKARPDSELFARRVLFAAVNDDSEWVRGMAYLSLIDSPFEAIRDEALRGVRDESVGIRLALLTSMALSPKAHYRSALRMAIVDQVAIVRAATLRAFAEQPGEVQVAEIQNVLNDKSPLVQAALKELATKKGLQIPPQ